MVYSWTSGGAVSGGVIALLVVLALLPLLAYAGLRTADRYFARSLPTGGLLSNLAILQFALPGLVMTKLPTLAGGLGLVLTAGITLIAGFNLRTSPQRFDDVEDKAGKEIRHGLLRSAGTWWVIAGVGVALLLFAPGGGWLVPAVVILLLVLVPLAGVAVALARLRA